MQIVRFVAYAAMALVMALPARAFETSAKNAWVYDLTSQTVLLDKGADEQFPPASMSKLMTINMLFEALEKGVVTMDTTMPVSTRAKNMGGSTMFLNEMDNPTVRELMQGIVINSGNDACVVVAEGLSTLEGLGGSEEAFAARMTERAKDLGMTNSHFANSSGWPAPGQVMTARDLGILAAHLIKTYPQYYPLFSETTFDYKNRAPSNAINRNPMLSITGSDWTADGMKTGHTQESGHGLVGSAKTDDRRIIFVLGGMATERERAQQGQAIANWAFRQFTLKTIANKGATLAEAPVWMGTESKVALVAEDNVRVLFPVGALENAKTEVVFNGPIAAPIKANDHIADLVISLPGEEGSTVVPLVAAKDIEKGGFMVHMRSAVERLAGRAIGMASGS